MEKSARSRDYLESPDKLSRHGGVASLKPPRYRSKTRHFSKDSSSGDYHIKQDRFFAHSSAANSQDVPSQFNYKWEVPVSYVTSEDPSTQHKVWFNHTMEKLTV